LKPSYFIEIARIHAYLNLKKRKSRGGDVVGAITSHFKNAKNEIHSRVYGATESFAVDVTQQRSALSRAMQVGFRTLIPLPELNQALFGARSDGCSCPACLNFVTGIRNGPAVAGLICNLSFQMTGSDRVNFIISSVSSNSIT
jgi:hypothetical protein